MDLGDRREMDPSDLYPCRPCPGCGDDPPMPEVFRNSSPGAESLAFEELKPHWHGFFQEKAFFSYVRCRQCGILFCRNYFSEAQLTELYSRMPDNTAGLPARAVQKTQKGYFHVLRKYSALQGHYLEIGPDIGLFSEYCVREGNFEHFWLFEPNRSIHAELKEVLGGKEFTLSEEMLDYGRIADGTLSTAVMIHVLDHLPDPVKVLQEIRTKLEDQGLLFLVTHDESSFLAKMTKDRWPAYCLQHPQLFSPSSLRTLLKKAGFRTLEIRKSYNHFPLLYLVKHLLWAAGLKIPVPSGNRFSIPLKLGNIITVAMKKDSGEDE